MLTIRSPFRKKQKYFKLITSKTFHPHEDMHIPQYINDVKNNFGSTLSYVRSEEYVTSNEVKNMVLNIFVKNP